MWVLRLNLFVHVKPWRRLVLEKFIEKSRALNFFCAGIKSNTVLDESLCLDKTLPPLLTVFVKWEHWLRRDEPRALVRISTQVRIERSVPPSESRLFDVVNSADFYVFWHFRFLYFYCL